MQIMPDIMFEFVYLILVAEYRVQISYLSYYSVKYFFQRFNKVITIINLCFISSTRTFNIKLYNSLYNKVCFSC